MNDGSKRRLKPIMMVVLRPDRGFAFKDAGHVEVDRLSQSTACRRVRPRR
jgi:hypothetical protein